MLMLTAAQAKAVQLCLSAFHLLTTRFGIGFGRETKVLVSGTHITITGVLREEYRSIEAFSRAYGLTDTPTMAHDVLSTFLPKDPEGHIWLDEGEHDEILGARIMRKVPAFSPEQVHSTVCAALSLAYTLDMLNDAKRTLPSFEDAWIQYHAGKQYGKDALEQVRMGYELARKAFTASRN